MSPERRLLERRARRKARAASRTADQEADKLLYRGRVLTRGVAAWDRMVKIASNPLPPKESTSERA